MSYWLLQHNRLEDRTGVRDDFVAQRFLDAFSFTTEQLEERRLLPTRYPSQEEADAAADDLNDVAEVLAR